MEELLNIQDYLKLTDPYTTEKSNNLIANADSKDTIMGIVQDIHRCYMEGLTNKWVLDAKVYDVLPALKAKYGRELNWYCHILDIGIF